MSRKNPDPVQRWLRAGAAQDGNGLIEATSFLQVRFASHGLHAA
jgi:hypothetical protein